MHYSVGGFLLIWMSASGSFTMSPWPCFTVSWFDLHVFCDVSLIDKGAFVRTRLLLYVYLLHGVSVWVRFLGQWDWARHPCVVLCFCCKAFWDGGLVLFVLFGDLLVYYLYAVPSSLFTLPVGVIVRLQLTPVISTSLISNNRLSRSEIWSLPKHENLKTGKNIVEKRRTKEQFLIFSTTFSIYL